MKCTDPGVLEGSDYYFATPSIMAQNLFYYILSIGDFTCSANYHVKRAQFNSLLLMYILDGSCTVLQGNNIYPAKVGDVVFLNCYHPHEYYTDSHLKFMWLHFDGGQGMDFYENILKEQEIVFPCEVPELFKQSLTTLLNIFRNGQTLSEPSVSCIIYTLLCNLTVSTSVTGTIKLEDNITGGAIQYMKENIRQDLTVQRISQEVHISPSHFSRVFKKQTGYSPYEYVIKLRIDIAKKLLKSSKLSIAEIALEAGFHNPSNFIYIFGEKVGLSPNKFRNTPF